jgi:hypothetical protein
LLCFPLFGAHFGHFSRLVLCLNCKTKNIFFVVLQLNKGLTHLLSGALFYGLWRFFVQMRF